MGEEGGIKEELTLSGIGVKVVFLEVEEGGVWYFGAVDQGESRRDMNGSSG